MNIGDKVQNINNGLCGVIVDIRLYYRIAYIYIKLANDKIVCYYPFELKSLEL